jgi:integrase/recombinase XerD
MTPPALGPLLQSFFVHHLVAEKGLRQASVRSYRDAMCLLLRFTAADRGCPITRLDVADLTLERVLGFLRHLEEGRHNGVHTRNQRLAAVHTFFEYVANRLPELLPVCQRIAAIPVKRSTLPETRFLERDEIAALFTKLPTRKP